jgi:hypothetical protein
MDQLGAIVQSGDKPGIDSNRFRMLLQEANTPLEEFRLPVIIGIQKRYELPCGDFKPRISRGALTRIRLFQIRDAVAIVLGHHPRIICRTIIYNDDLCWLACL